MAEVYPHPKMTFGKWIENVWYYYKWFILLGIVVLTGIVIASVQFFSRTDPDASLLYVGPRVISEENCEKILSVVEKRMLSDPNGDGKLKAEMKTVALSTSYRELIGNELPGQTEYNAYLDYQNEILAGDGCILLVDPLFYEELKSDRAIMPLSDIFSELPDFAKECGFRLQDLSLWKEDGFSTLPGNTVLCFRFASSYSIQDEAERLKIQEENLAVFRDLCALS